MVLLRVCIAMVVALAGCSSGDQPPASPDAGEPGAKTLMLDPGTSSGTFVASKTVDPVDFQYSLVPVLGTQVLAVSVSSDDAAYYPILAFAHVATGGSLETAIDTIESQYDSRRFNAAAGRELSRIYLGAYQNGTVFGRVGWSFSLAADEEAVFEVSVNSLATPTVTTSGWIVTSSVIQPADVHGQLWPVAGSGAVYAIFAGAEDLLPVAFDVGSSYVFSGALAYIDEDAALGLGVSLCHDYQNGQFACYLTATPP